MIKEVKITNFKSIKELSFKAKKINIFIGKPNTGKSNILESLGVFSILYNPFSSNDSTLKPLVRFENIPDIFYNKETKFEIKVSVNRFFFWEGLYFSILDLVKGLFSPMLDIRITGTLEREEKIKEIYETSPEEKILEEGLFNKLKIFASLKCGEKFNTLEKLDTEVSLKGSWITLSRVLMPIKFYRFQTLSTFNKKEFNFLIPPNGENLLFILNTNQEIYDFVNSILKEYNLEIVLDELESKIRILVNASKKFFLPYNNLSDTLQRTIFHFVAILSNKNSVLLFEEPESHSFPYYTKLLAEMIADDKNNNQYFISTHNPYFLYTLIEKAPKEDLAIFVTYLKDYQTKIRELTEKEIEAIREREFDPFFQFDE